MPASDKLVIITRKTALEELVERFNTRDQARFYIDHMGGRFADYQEAHDAYHHALEFLHNAIPRGVRTQWIDRSFLPTFTFGSSDVAVVLGQDGLVVNAAKYLNGQPVVAARILIPRGLTVCSCRSSSTRPLGRSSWCLPRPAGGFGVT